MITCERHGAPAQSPDRGSGVLHLTPLADRGDIDISDPDVVRDEVQKILDTLTTAFWTSEWSAKSLDTSAGRQLVVDALVQIRRNIRRDIPWYTDVQLVATPDPA